MTQVSNGKDKFSTLFQNDRKVETIAIDELIKWRTVQGEGRLLLPPIQRSLVWSNAQIINYWDSLLRGYPAGMMMVHRANASANDAPMQGRDYAGHTQEAQKGDWQLFDGQQRLAAILLGFGMGEWSDSRKLWLELGSRPNERSGLKFQLRMSSLGQPFGYRIDEPNQKFELRRRQDKWREACWKDKRLQHAEVFSEVHGRDLIDAKVVVALSCISKSMGKECNVESLIADASSDSKEILKDFTDAFVQFMQSNIIIQLIDAALLDKSNYIRLFTRLGQGGTALTNDELTYSLIKHAYPGTHDRMRIIDKTTGRLAAEVDLVLGALRVSKTFYPKPEAPKWEIVSRPTPTFVSKLHNEWPSAEKYFLRMIPPAHGEEPCREEHSVELFRILSQIRKILEYDNKNNPDGLPSMLLARLPEQLVDVLMLFVLKGSYQEEPSGANRIALRAFTLHWLLFVGDDNKAAELSFRLAINSEWKPSPENLRQLIKQYENDNISRTLARPEDLEKMIKGVEHPKSPALLRAWAERFVDADKDDFNKPGTGLRVLSTNKELIMRALMWLQRGYLASSQFHGYDPTSGRDEDLPVDLDHLIPYSLFGDDWRRLTVEDAYRERFRSDRNTVGNSLGNYRWLDASDNRARQAMPLEAEFGVQTRDDMIEGICPWNEIIEKVGVSRKWSANEIVNFQRLIDLRSIKLYKMIILHLEAAEIV